MKRNLFLLVLSLCLLVCGCSGTSGERKTAVTVGDIEIDNVEMMYRYKEAITDFYNQNYSFISMLGLDLSGDLSTQMISETQSWRDYFIESAMYSLMEEKYLVNEANAVGFELSEEQLADVDNSFENFYAQLDSYGYEIESYLSECYGEDITVEDFERYVMNDAIAFYYYQKLISDIDVSDSVLDAYYNENKKDFDSVDFRIYHFTYTVPETEDGEDSGDESYKDEAKKAAEAAYEAVNSLDEFDPYIRSILTAEELEVWTEDYSFATAKYEEVFTELADWLYDDSRVEGDKTVLEYNGGYFFVMFAQRYFDSYRTVDVRHCLVATSTVSNILVEDSDEIDYEATAAAQEASDAEKFAQAESLLNEWIAGGATEEAFAKMADDNSDDSAEGGLYEAVLKGDMIDEFDSWCFDESRQPGDYDIVLTSYGYHIMYFVGYNEFEWKLTAKDEIQKSEYEKMYEDFGEKYPVIRNSDVLADIG